MSRSMSLAIILTIMLSPQCFGLSPERVQQIHQEVLREIRLDSAPRPQVGETGFICQDDVGGMSLEASHQWALLYNQEHGRTGRTKVSNEFMNRTVSDSGGSLIKLVKGTKVQVIIKQTDYTYKVQILTGRDAGKSCFVSAALLTAADPVAEKERAAQFRQTEEEKSEAERQFVSIMNSGEWKIASLQPSPGKRAEAESPPLQQQGVPKDLQAAADSGNTDAQVRLATMYSKGEGVPRDRSKAIEWYQKAADNGDAKAETSLGIIYLNGWGTPRNYSKALEWLQKAADKGYGDAQHSLASMYLRGQGVPQDYGKALEWFQKAADNGIQESQCNLALMYLQGYGVPRDYDKARELLLKAANNGDAGAMFNLGVIYAEGTGVPRDLNKAIKWYQRAANKGNRNAIRELNSLTGG